eukprot:4145117-Amphidinium_carterae.1
MNIRIRADGFEGQVAAQTVMTLRMQVLADVENYIRQGDVCSSSNMSHVGGSPSILHACAHGGN